MGKVVAEKKKKKKGRPSLLDLQKRSLRQQQQQQLQQKQQQKNQHRNSNLNPNPNYSNSRRFSRRYPYQSEVAEKNDGYEQLREDDEGEENHRRKQKKLKLVLRLPRSFNSIPHLQNSKEDSDADSASDDESENGEKQPLKKRKINAVSAAELQRIGGVCNGSVSPSGADGNFNAGSAHEKAERQNSTLRTVDPFPVGAPSVSASTTPLPDRKLLLFVLDRLQKKDTYGVFSEPVDPKELPDYHEVIQHPMDFGTVKKKLACGAYSNLEQFEKDVFLICSNAMRYNAPDTIYFRQARSIQDLATKNFQNLRQDSDSNERELVRSAPRGRPPKKSIKRPVGRPPLEPAGSDFSSDATPGTAGDNSAWSNTSHEPTRKRAIFDKPGYASGFVDVSARTSHRLRNSETSTTWLADYRSERNDEVPGSMFRGMHAKYGRKSSVLEENRRGTYKLSNQLVSGRDQVFSTFDGEKQQLLSVGLHMEHAYARSLARFAANLGPVAWKIASGKIIRALPAGTKFGPGWVGESESPLQALTPPPPTHCQPKVSPSTTAEMRSDKLSETQEPLKNQSQDGLLSGTLPPSTPAAAAANGSHNPIAVAETGTVFQNSESGLSSVNSGVGVGNRLNKPSFRHNTTVNGVNGMFNLPSLVQGNLPLSAIRPAGQFGSEAMASSRRPDLVSGSTGFIHPAPSKQSETEGTTAELEKDWRFLASSNSINSGNSFPEYDQESKAASRTGLQAQPTWQGLSPHQKPNSVPPDLNVGFQPQGSPVRHTSGMGVDSQLPDLALQL